MNNEVKGRRYRSTLHDVARTAGVSASTVSAVLTGKSDIRRISKRTDHRVREVAESLGYTPNLFHRSLQKGRTRVISFYNAFRYRNGDDLYLDRLSLAIENACGALGYDVLIHCNYSATPEHSYEVLTGGLVDGLVLFAPGPSDPLFELIRGSKLPTVVIDPPFEQGISFVREDVEQGMQIVAEQIVNAGHRRLGVVLGTTSPCSDRSGRLSLLRKALDDHGIEIPDSALIPWTGDESETVANLLAVSPRPTVFFVWRDSTAYKLIDTCESLGMNIPKELSFFGYDGLRWPSTSTHTVTSISFSVEEVATSAVQILHRQLRNEIGPLSQVVPVRYSPGTTLALTNSGNP